MGLHPFEGRQARQGAKVHLIPTAEKRGKKTLISHPGIASPCPESATGVIATGQFSSSCEASFSLLHWQVMTVFLQPKANREQKMSVHCKMFYFSGRIKSKKHKTKLSSLFLSLNAEPLTDLAWLQPSSLSFLLVVVFCYFPILPRTKLRRIQVPLNYPTVS